MKRYEALAEKIEEMIQSGVLTGGDKAPSIRQASVQHGVSPSTVFQAYYLLESRGLIRARERSGYYVNENIKNLLPEPGPTRPAVLSTNVKVSDLVFSVLEAMRVTDIAQLGSAFPAPELFPLQKLAQSLARANRYSDPSSRGANLTPGNEDLRRAIALRYMTAGVSVSADDIIITDGALEGLSLALQAITKPGDVIAIESPGFYAALQMIERLNLKAIEIPMDPNEGLDLSALEDAINNHGIRACWCMTNFQNPLGSSTPEEKKKTLVSLLAKYEIPLIEDDVYGELYFGSKYPRPAKTFDTQGLVLHCSSFSKSLAPGYRIGWILPGRYYESVRRAKLMTTLSASVPAQLALADYLQQGSYDRHLRKLRQALESQQAQMVKAIGAYFPAGCKVTRPKGGYFLWVELPLSVNSLELYRQSLAHSINLAPGPIFSSTTNYDHCIRLNYGQVSGEIEEAIKTIGTLAHELIVDK